MSLIKNIKQFSPKEHIRLDKRVANFLICLLISTFFWLLMSLSMDYAIVENFPVKYINLPKEKVLSNELPETIDIEIKSSGFNLLLYKLKPYKKTVLIDVKDAKPLQLKNHYYLYTEARIDRVKSQFSSEIKIQKISPDTLLFNFNKKVSKTVPVKAMLNLSFDNNYQQDGEIKLKPSTIKISGAAELINKIDSVVTGPMNLDNLTDSRTVKLNILVSPDLNKIDLSQSTVEATIKTAKYTEGSIELPIEVENLPRGYSLKTFPNKIMIKYNVAFDNYEKIKASQFRVVVDYKKIEEGNNKLKIKLVEFPKEVSAVKLSIEKVEYIIRK